MLLRTEMPVPASACLVVGKAMCLRTVKKGLPASHVKADKKLSDTVRARLNGCEQEEHKKWEKGK